MDSPSQIDPVPILYPIELSARLTLPIARNRCLSDYQMVVKPGPRRRLHSRIDNLNDA